MISDEELVARWDAGERMAEIARDLGLTRERVRQRLKRHGRGGPNRNRLPTADALRQAATNATSILGISRVLQISPVLIEIAVNKFGLRRELHAILAETRRLRADEARLASQRPYIAQIREIALNVGHTPTQGELQEYGIYHVELNRLFGSVPLAMRTIGLEPNVPGHPPLPLPAGFGKELEPTVDFALLLERAHLLAALGVPQEAPPGEVAPVKEVTTTQVFRRSPAVAAWVLQTAGGVCECCGHSGYELDDGSLFLEVHHVVPLASGGPDVVSNTVAVCETCHGKFHRWKFRDDLTRSLYKKVNRLLSTID